MLVLPWEKVMKRSGILFVAMACATALSAVRVSHAAERGFYAGAAYSDVSAEFGSGPVLVAGSSSGIFDSGVNPVGSRGIKVVGGYRALDWLAIEADYLDLSRTTEKQSFVCVTTPCQDRNQADTSSASLSALALWPVGKFDLFLRAGFMSWTSDVEYINNDGTVAGSVDFGGTNEKYGFGAQFNLRRITARLEYEDLRFGAVRAESWSLGFAYRFR
jgi:hypothetical protein